MLKPLFESIIDWSWSFNKNQTNTAPRREIKQYETRRWRTQCHTRTSKK